MTTQDDPIPGWGSNSLVTISQPHDAATVMDGIKLGLGMAIAWLVLVPLIVVTILIVLCGIG